MASLANQIARLQRGLGRGHFSPAHAAQARAALGALQKRARVRRENATIYNPNAILAGGPLRQAVNAQVRSSVAPLLGEQKRIGAQANANVGQVQSLFRDLAGAQSAAMTRQTQIGSTAVQNQVDIAGRQNTALQGIADKADTALGGAANPYTQGARAQLMNLVDSQKGVAANQQAGAQTAASNLAANSQSLLNAQGASTQMRGPEIASAIQQKATIDKNALGAQIADLRGPGRAKILADYMTGERNFLGAAKALNLQTAKFKEDVHQNRANFRIAFGKLREDRRHNRITEQQLGQRLLTEQQNADTAKGKAFWTNKVNKWKLDHPKIPLGGRAGKGGKGGAAGATPLQRRTNFNTFSDIAGYVKQNPGATPQDFGAPHAGTPGAALLYQVASDHTYQTRGIIPRKFYPKLHKLFPGILTKGK